MSQLGMTLYKIFHFRNLLIFLRQFFLYEKGYSGVAFNKFAMTLICIDLNEDICL
jgi:hypothetical protein